MEMPLLRRCGLAGAVLYAALLLTAVARPAEPAPEVDLPPLPETTHIPSKQEARETLRRQKAIAEEKLRVAEVLLKLSRYSDAIGVCDELLALQPDNERARKLKTLISQRMVDATDDTLEVEAHHRDREVLQEVTKWGTAPERAPDLERPDPDQADLPFQRPRDESARIEAMLSSEIPEINLVATPVDYVLQLLFKTHDINIIYPPEAVEDKAITIQARNITLREILDYLSRQHDLHYTVSRGTVWMYAGGEDRGRALFRPEIIQIRSGLTPEVGQGGEGGGEGGEAVISDIEAMLEWMEDHWPGWPEETTWRLNRKTNQLIVNSTPEIVEDIREVVHTLDVPADQVLITAVFVEIGEKDYNQLGFTWSVTGNPQEPGDPNEGYRYRDNKITIPAESTFNTGMVAPTDGTVKSLGMGAVGVLSEHQFQMTMDALMSRSTTRVMRAPRVIALSNHQAIIKITDKFPYPTDWESTTAGVTSDTNQTVSTTIVPSAWAEEDVGFELRVGPSVGADRRTIYLRIIPTITVHDAQNDVQHNIVISNPDGNDTVVPVTRPVFSTKELDVEAVVEDGETVVIGGLISDETSRGSKKVPILGDVPLFGKLFRNRDDQRIRSFELIFLTARIITPDNRHYRDPDALLEATPVVEVKPAEVSPETVNRWLDDPIER
ncbi:MAG: FecR domain-containing protein [Planctomycetota bacterium]